MALNNNYVSKQSSIQNGTPKEFQSDSFESNYFRKISYGQIINSKYSYFLALDVAEGKGRVAKSQFHIQRKNCFTVQSRGTKMSVHARTAKHAASGKHGGVPPLRHDRCKSLQATVKGR